MERPGGGGAVDGGIGGARRHVERASRRAIEPRPMYITYAIRTVGAHAMSEGKPVRHMDCDGGRRRHDEARDGPGDDGLLDDGFHAGPVDSPLHDVLGTIHHANALLLVVAVNDTRKWRSALHLDGSTTRFALLGKQGAHSRAFEAWVSAMAKTPDGAVQVSRAGVIFGVEFLARGKVQDVILAEGPLLAFAHFDGVLAVVAARAASAVRPRAPVGSVVVAVFARIQLDAGKFGGRVEARAVFAPQVEVAWHEWLSAAHLPVDRADRTHAVFFAAVVTVRTVGVVVAHLREALSWPGVTVLRRVAIFITGALVNSVHTDRSLALEVITTHRDVIAGFSPLGELDTDPEVVVAVAVITLVIVLARVANATVRIGGAPEVVSAAESLAAKLVLLDPGAACSCLAKALALRIRGAALVVLCACDSHEGHQQQGHHLKYV